jgi:hypothetical protein
VSLGVPLVCSGVPLDRRYRLVFLGVPLIAWTLRVYLGVPLVYPGVPLVYYGVPLRLRAAILKRAPDDTAGFKCGPDLFRRFSTGQPLVVLLEQCRIIML